MYLLFKFNKWILLLGSFTENQFVLHSHFLKNVK